MVFNKNNKKEISAIDDLIKSKIYVNPKRFEELNKLKEGIWDRPAESPEEPCTLLCFNPIPEVEDKLRNLEGYSVQVERISEDPADPSHKEDRKRFLKVFGGKRLEEARVVAIIHELGSQEEELTLLDKRVIALSLLNKLPVVVLATGVPDALPAAAAASGGTWPVFFVPHPHEDMRPVCKWLMEELPRVRALSAAIEADLQARVAHLARVNLPLHFLSRASVALVPFGVMTVNFLGILRLMANMLQAVGMRGDTSANKAIGLLGAKNAALVTAIDSMGDVYSFAVFATVLADLQGLGLVEAAAAMDVLDGLMLGSISVVTGAVSALGAYLSRPMVVRAAAEFLASLQTIHVLNPAMRRASERRPRRDGAAGGKKGEGKRKGKGKKGRGRKGEKGATEEELRGLLKGSGGGGGGGTRLSRVGEGAAAVAAAAEEATAAAGGRDGNDWLEVEAGDIAREGQGGNSASTSEESSGEASSDEEEDEEEDAEEEEKDEGGDGKVRDQGAHAEADSTREGGGADGVRAIGGDDEGNGTAVPNALSRAEKKEQALAQRQAAREAKAAEKAAKAAAKAEARAARSEARAAAKAAKAAAKEEKRAAVLEDKERRRLEKQQQREHKAAEKAEKAAAKKAARDLHGASQPGAAVAVAAAGANGGGSMEPSASAAAEAGAGMQCSAGGDPSASSCGSASRAETKEGATGAKAPWWRRRKDGAAVPAAGGEQIGTSGTGATRGPEAVGQGSKGSGRGGGGGGGDRSSGGESRGSEETDGEGEDEGERGGGGEDAAGEELDERVAAALSLEERMGLDEEACRGLLEFLNLPDEEVYCGGAEDQAPAPKATDPKGGV